MGVPKELDLHCPHCGARTRIQVWTNVNAAQNPELAERIVDGSMFQAECVDCREPIPLQHAIHFHDPARRVYYRFDGESGGIKPNAAGIDSLAADYAMRRAPDFNALKELVHVWLAGLDDRPMLLIKHLVAADVQADSGRPPVVCSFDRRTGDRLEYALIADEESEPETAEVPLDVYHQLCEAISPHAGRFFPMGRWVDWDHVTAKRVWDVIG